MDPRRRTARVKLVTALLAGGLVLAGCTGGGQSAPPLQSETPSSTPPS